VLYPPKKQAPAVVPRIPMDRRLQMLINALEHGIRGNLAIRQTSNRDSQRCFTFERGELAQFDGVAQFSKEANTKQFAASAGTKTVPTGVVAL